MSVGLEGNNCFPEAPDITVNTTEVLIGDDEVAALFTNDDFDVTESTGGAGLIFTLSKTPLSASAVICVKDGITGRYTADFTVLGDVLTLTTALVTGEHLYVHYMGTTT